MEKLTKDSPETRSLDVVAENIAQLKALFPDATTEGRIDFEVLKQLLGGEVEDREEKFGLNWHGKRQARQLALSPSVGTLRPCPEESLNWNSTSNLVIEGDNLEVLKLLQKGYSNEIKLIFIDPPYNTGNDFVYSDDFSDNIQNYLSKTKQIDDGGKRVGSNTDSSGRFHTDWLNMIYPRLRLAKNLLDLDGLIFITIDDNEVAHLRAIMDEIFGSENFIGNAVWQKAYTANMTAAFISNTHDHILIYAKNADYAELGRFDRSDEQKEKFKNPDNDPRGPWKAENLSAGKFYSAGQFKIIGPTGQEFLPPPGRYWRCNENQYNIWLSDNRITFGISGEGRPMLKKFLSEVAEGLTPSTWWNHEDFGTNKEASIELKDIFDGDACFQTPKPIKLLRKIVSLAKYKDALVLDFFAGSGTTGHATMLENLEDGGTRRFILVQLPEALDINDKDQKLAAETCDKLGFPRSIAELTKERLRRASNIIVESNPLFQGDLGFRVFKLDSSNIRPWEANADNLPQTLMDAVEHIKEGRTEQDLLFELLLKLGLDLTVPMEQKTIAGKTVHSIGAGVLMVCLGEAIAKADYEALGNGIVAWHRELAPTGETTLVFRDSAFADDVVKTNLTAILSQGGLDNVRSL